MQVNYNHVGTALGRCFSLIAATMFSLLRGPLFAMSLQNSSPELVIWDQATSVALNISAGTSSFFGFTVLKSLTGSSYITEALWLNRPEISPGTFRRMGKWIRKVKLGQVDLAHSRKSISTVSVWPWKMFAQGVCS
ncbi:hypothetical protein ACU8KH_06505 [Lachancea thermotolerans]